jgi:hypothetical protein
VPDDLLNVVCGNQFAVTKFFAIGSQVSFFAAITQRYRKFMGSITERVISGSNSNSQMLPKLATLWAITLVVGDIDSWRS